MLGINISIGGDNSKLQGALQGAEEKVKQFAAKISTSLKGVFEANVYQKITEGIGAAFTDPLEKIKESFAMGGELELLHSRTGASIQDLLLLQEGFKQSGLSADQVGPAINKMQKALSGVNEEGGDTTSIFNRLGIDPKKLGVEDAASQMKVLQQKISALPTATERAAAAMQVFGKTGGEMLAMRHSGSRLARRQHHARNAPRRGSIIGSTPEVLAKREAIYLRSFLANSRVSDKIRF